MQAIADPAPAALSLSERVVLSRAIKQQARTVGFEKVGLVQAETLQQERQKLLDWLARGYEGEMAWMRREPHKRTDPRILFPAARSVVVVALNYYTPHKHRNDSETGKVSRYAWGDDYHDVVGSKLHTLLDWIQMQVPTVEGKVCVDIQPMMDKAWAVRAGLGWIGKHTNLITQEYGSWVFIGELLLNLELEYDVDEVEDHCGNCTLCIDACPTTAIVEPYVVDSNLCISHATIESRAPQLREDVAEKLEGWFYGCDICQDVCPWNRFEQPTTETRFRPRGHNVNASLSETLALTPAAYAERFRGSAMKRAKLAGFQRNAQALLESRER
jgi:epoxyqueuosine reductase